MVAAVGRNPVKRILMVLILLSVLLATSMTACISDPVHTARQMDGGPGYWGRFSNGYPADDSVFPIAAFNWNENQNTGNTSAAWKAAGINTVFNFYDAPNVAEVNAAGLYSIVKPESNPPSTSGLNKVVGWIPGDEPDGNATVYCGNLPTWLKPCSGDANNRTLPEDLAAGVQKLHNADPTRAAFAEYTKPVAIGEGLYDPNRAPYLVGKNGLPGPDVAGFDYYPATDPYANPDGQGNFHHWWDQCGAVQGMRQEANYSRPIWATIITSSGQTNSWWAYDPLPAEIRAEVWTAIVCGAQGIIYFKNNLDNHFAPTHPGTIDIFTDSHYVTNVAAIKQVNSEIKAFGKFLTPAAPYADNVVTNVSGNVNLTVKVIGGAGSGYAYLVPIVGKQNGAQTVTLTVNLPDGTPVTDKLTNEPMSVSSGHVTMNLGSRQVRALVFG